MKTKPELSIVATCYNDSCIIRSLIQAIEQNLNPLQIDYEIILVNDSSPDDTEQVIEKICTEKNYVKGISL